MTALACVGEPKFVPSLLETPAGRPRYSVETIRLLKQKLDGRDHLYFLMGVDAFLDLPQWKNPERLLDETDFIIVSRPGFRVRKIMSVIPKHLIEPASHRRDPQTVSLRHSRVCILNGVYVPVASSDLRAALRRGRPVTGLIPPFVEEYIVKEGVYRR